MQVHMEKGLVIRAPFKLPVSEIEEFLLKKSKWIREKIDYRSKILQQINPIKLENRNQIDLLGQIVPIKKITHQGRRLSIEYTGKLLIISIPHMIIDTNLSSKVRTKIITWFKLFAKEHIELRISYYEDLMDIKPKFLKIRSYKARWGSCRNDGLLTFNWKIIQAPKSVVNYIIVHELAHLKYMNHSTEFWKLIELHYPNYQNAKVWLKTNVLQLQWV